MGLRNNEIEDLHVCALALMRMASKWMLRFIICVDRWQPEMEQGGLTVKHWRKSAQWASLNRKHAKLVADDVQVADVFAKHCRVGKDKKTGKEQLCISDEVRH